MVSFGAGAPVGIDYAVRNAAKADAIVTSALKNVGDTLYNVIKSHQAGTLNWGKLETFGIKEGGVGLAVSVPPDTGRPLRPEGQRKNRRAAAIQKRQARWNQMVSQPSGVG